MAGVDDSADQARTTPDDASPDPRGSMLSRFETAVAGATDGAGEDPRVLPDRWCQAVVDVLGVDGAAISVYLGADLAVPIGASDVETTTGEALQFTLREGPCFEAYESRRPILISNLERPGSAAWSRWPAYAAELTRRTPYRGVFAFPLLVSGVAMGSLGVYQRDVGELEHLDEVSAIAEWISGRVLEAEMSAANGGLPGPRWMESPAGLRRRQVWLAQGFVLQSNRVTPGEAIDLLRAQAFTSNRLLDDLADDIVAGRLPVPVLQSDH
jgi:hypothetical protein